MVNPPKRVIRIPPTRGTVGIFLSKNHTIKTEIIVATIRGGIAT